ncbi:unnamed protein product [Bursaphelenchus xylophilus]|uniref:Transmembrane 9 superfamily member n=1 Tax=Bursaphelenchus xylophilus TaxID=6326 RepID=A0A7I8XKN5_BURXY|nr:unnamed protein product [Bursaphelenchus xylophilus]CAG9085811.1 unnamed protein product [Bursaphelenchus xylophilus]
MRHKNYVILLLLLLSTSASQGFYVPGVAPNEFKIGDVIEVKGIKLTSIKSVVPYEYYSLPFCKPNGQVHYKSENLGEVMRGDRIVNTPFDVYMKTDSKCQTLCPANKEKKTLTVEETNLLIRRIHEDYHVHLLVDNLPCATMYEVPEKPGEYFYDNGYRIGWTEGEKTYVYNHLELVLKYHEPTAGVHRVVGFEVRPKSINADSFEISGDRKCSIGASPSFQELKKDSENTIVWSYSVKWEESSVPWASRWDILLKSTDVQIHWFSILNSLVVVACLAGFLSVIIIRTVRKDISKYNRADDLEDALEETGWKLVHADVFRPPRYHMLLVNFVGTGIQIIGMVVVTVTFAMLGMLSPSSRGSLTSVAIFLYCFMGLVAGYHSGRLYKTFKGEKPRSCAFRTATLFPTVVLGTGFVINFFLIGKHSSGAIPFTTMIALLFLWLGIDLPLVFIGFHFGYRKQPYSHPVRTNQIPRQVPDQPWYLKTLPCALIAGVLPFAIWENQFYYLFGFLWLVVGILFVSCTQIAIVVTYFQLCAENYHWWWKSFSVSTGSALYVFAYSVYYYYTKLSIEGFVPTLLYFVYSSLISITFAVLTGTVGFYAAYFFLRRIYGAVKVD